MTQAPGDLTAALADRYHVERELGRGGMAIVYLARDLRHDRPVGLKVLHPELAARLGPERFLREIHLAARLQHPHILPVLDSGEAAGLLWYAIEGESLRDRIRRDVQLSVAEAVRISREVASAIAYANAKGVVHRDIKPENILLSTEGHATVADFGIAKVVTSAGGQKITETGFSVGTPAYMSPEQATAGAVDGRSDLYSLACVLYERLVGQPPHTGASAQAIIARRMTEPPPRMRTVRDGIPETIERVVQRRSPEYPLTGLPTPTNSVRSWQLPWEPPREQSPGLWSGGRW